MTKEKVKLRVFMRGFSAVIVHILAVEQRLSREPECKVITEVGSWSRLLKILRDVRQFRRPLF